ncbi:fatty acid synthase-like isoform X1 [Vespa crabro]|uniref:fatty acid synthase-like isoform X1 n=1 Tax=Vespa crabro TaxID=7445 RepID=UPI001F016D7E|nr:fatty acid synthase-like isoform X1 [Vespa crabro]
MIVISIINVDFEYISGYIVNDKNGYQRMRIKIWESYGVNITILVGLDSTKPEECKLIVKTAIYKGSLNAILNLAVSLRDSICKNQMLKTFEEPFKAKAWSTKCLEKVTRKLCPDLQHFVVFSSVLYGKGNPGQTNYDIKDLKTVCHHTSLAGFRMDSMTAVEIRR